MLIYTLFNFNNKNVEKSCGPNKSVFELGKSRIQHFPLVSGTGKARNSPFSKAAVVIFLSHAVKGNRITEQAYRWSWMVNSKHKAATLRIIFEALLKVPIVALRLKLLPLSRISQQNRPTYKLSRWLYDDLPFHDSNFLARLCHIGETCFVSSVLTDYAKTCQIKLPLRQNLNYWRADGTKDNPKLKH